MNLSTGIVPGLCHNTNLTVGHSYVILASRDEKGDYRPTDGEFDASNRTLMRRLMSACGLQTAYPWGKYVNILTQWAVVLVKI